jgi:CRISPR-associated protein Csd2
MNEAIKNRYDFVYLFDVKDGNPNGDPDQANLPRADAENQQGLVTDVCIKRKVRNWIQLKHDLKTPYDIFIRQRDINSEESYLNKVIEKATGNTSSEKRMTMCQQYYDIRTFGAVLSTGSDEEKAEDLDKGQEAKSEKKKTKKIKGAGTVRGPVQFTFARSEDRIYQADHSLTRCCVTTEREKNDQLKKDREFASTFGRKSTVPYGLYRMHGFVSAMDAQKTCFSEKDLELLWESLLNAFENDHAAARGEMRPRKLVIFKHASHLGNARSGVLFDLVKVGPSKDAQKPARSFADYSVTAPQQADMPQGVDVLEKL